MIYQEVKLSDIIIPKFHALFNDVDHMHQILTSGRAGTKSSYMGILSDYLIAGEAGTAVVIMRKHHVKLEKTVFKECLRAMKRLKLNKKYFKITKKPMRITNIKNSNTIYFTGSDSVDDTKGMIDENNAIKLVVLDELTEFFDKGEGEDEINNIVATFVRGNDKDFRMLYLYNPPKNPKAPINEWCHKMEQRTDCIHIHVTYQDVPVSWLGKKLIDEANAMKQADEKMYNWIWLGKSVGLDDLIYYMFNPEKHVINPKKSDDYDLLFVGIDAGQLNATTYEAYGLDFYNKRFQGLYEYYYSGRDTGVQKSPSEYASDFRDFIDSIYDAFGEMPVYACIDPSAVGLAEEIKRVCPEVIFPKIDNTVELGISRVQKLLIFFVLKLSIYQKELEKEMYLYSYDPDSIDKGKEKPIKQNDHCQDATRYAVMGAWDYIVNMLPMLND